MITMIYKNEKEFQIEISIGPDTTGKKVILFPVHEKTYSMLVNCASAMLAWARRPFFSFFFFLLTKIDENRIVTGKPPQKQFLFLSLFSLSLRFNRQAKTSIRNTTRRVDNTNLCLLSLTIDLVFVSVRMRNGGKNV